METIIKKVEHEKVEQLKQWMEENKVSAGINIDEDTKRYYPYSTVVLKGVTKKKFLMQKKPTYQQKMAVI